MNYGFSLHGELDRDRLAAALAEVFSLPVRSVDVGDEGDDDRNWDAPISCTVSPLAGDLRWHLDVYVRETVPGPAPEPLVAALLARRLGTVVAYEAGVPRPSAYWLVGPDGTRTRARILEEDSADIPVYRIDAVERPLRALPGLPVARVPEVIREYRMPTPLTDRLRDRRFAGQAEVTSLLGAWESMVARLHEGWVPDGWYPAEYYREDLEIRDRLAAATSPEPAAAEVARALAEIDQRFRAATEDDGGRALAAATGALPPGDERWWWRRVPDPPPWHDA